MIRYLTAGESHGKALVGIIEGIPAGVEISVSYINHQLKRRQQGYGRGGRMRIESDEVEILAGVRYGKTIGSPIALLIHNRDSENWSDVMAIDENDERVDPVTIPRPGHADYAGAMKYGFNDLRNVIERASARETAMRVACCTIARKFLEDVGLFIGSHILRIGKVSITNRKKIDEIIQSYTKASCGAYKITEEADKSPVRMLDKRLSEKARNEIRIATKRGDTLGGIFEIIVTGVPVGLGSYVHYDRKLDGQLAQALMSIQAVKGVEIGDGFGNSAKFGSEVHDEFAIQNERIVRTSNRAGGIEGGVSNGEPIVLRSAMKPISTLAKPLRSIDLKKGKDVESRYERSDICAVPACSVIGEAVIVPVLANAILEKYGGDSLQDVKSSYASGKN